MKKYDTKIMKEVKVGDKLPYKFGIEITTEKGSFKLPYSESIINKAPKKKEMLGLIFEAAKECIVYDTPEKYGNAFPNLPKEDVPRAYKDTCDYKKNLQKIGFSDNDILMGANNFPYRM